MILKKEDLDEMNLDYTLAKQNGVEAESRLAREIAPKLLESALYVRDLLDRKKLRFNWTKAEELAILDKQAERIRQNPELGRKMLIGAGICEEDENGELQLTEHYRE